jgi:hypothetical protein
VAELSSAVIALRAVIPAGGHCNPGSTVGASEEKYAQRILRKKKSSVTIVWKLP